MPDETAVLDAPGEVCGCPGGSVCGHDGQAAPIPIRAGFILCVLGKEKLCPDCVVAFGDAFKCHGSHHDS